jgi:glycosyltransferase involved in cell wall biosynthesis
MPHPHPSVTACIPYHQGARYIRRAVSSLLAQTHRDLRIVVVNDGDRNPPWEILASCGDPRIVCFDLTRNHGGPFFANAVVANATKSPWFLVQEQDDWSDPQRVQQLLHLACVRGADVALSAQLFHRQQDDGSSTPVGKRWQHFGRLRCPSCRAGARCSECFVDLGIVEGYRYRAPHAGLFRVDLLRRIGGYYAGLNLHFDALLMNLLLMTGTIAHTPDALYHRLLQSGSITHSRHTGFGSRPSDRERGIVVELYRRSYAEYRRYLQGKLSSSELVDSICHSCQERVSPAERQELANETNRLRARLDDCAARA